MVEVDVLHGVVGGVDVGVVVAEGSLEDERRGVSVAIGRGMIRASVATGGLLIGNVGVLVGSGPESVGFHIGAARNSRYARIK
jgi:hypothetical protein